MSARAWHAWLMHPVMAVLFGGVIGAVSALILVYAHAQGAEVRGGWKSWSGSAAADRNPYAAAAIAFRGILSMNRRESRYFIREKDEMDRPLREGCTYELVLPDQPARWWSLALYAGGETFADNSDDAHSVSALSVGERADQPYRVRIGPAPAGAGNWLSTNGAGPFMLMLRLYVPDPDTAMAPPEIRTLSCEPGA